MFFAHKKKRRHEIDLIAMTAHQFRRPLSSMKLSLQMLLNGDFGPLQTTQKDIVEKIIKHNEALMCLVGDLLDMARAEDLYAHAPEPVDVANIIDGAIALNYGDITRKKLHIEFDRSNVMPSAIINKNALLVAVQNIIDNAVKYTGEGGWIKISSAIRDKKIVVRVQDSGIGIPDREHADIFAKFFRASNARAHAMGSGLGLFIAKKFIKASGGTISFQSQEGSGSLFIVTLPIR